MSNRTLYIEGLLGFILCLIVCVHFTAIEVLAAPKTTDSFSVELSVDQDLIYHYSGPVHEGLYRLVFDDAYEDENQIQWHTVKIYKSQPSGWIEMDNFDIKEGGLIFEFLYTPIIWWVDFGDILVESDDSKKTLVNFNYTVYIPVLAK